MNHLCRREGFEPELPSGGIEKIIGSGYHGGCSCLSGSAQDAQASANLPPKGWKKPAEGDNQRLASC